jgi:hypothetical protein
MCAIRPPSTIPQVVESPATSAGVAVSDRQGGFRESTIPGKRM